MILYAVAAGLLFVLAISPARGQSFKKGNLLLSAGYGFGNDAGSFFSSLKELDNYKLKVAGPVVIKGEIAVSDKVGLGLNIAYVHTAASFTYLAINSNAEERTYKADIGSNAYSVLGRVNFHFLTTGRIDPYFGLGAGYRGRWTTINDNQPEGDYGFTVNNSITNVGFEMTIGTRYYPAPRWAIFGELGVAKAPVQIGLTYRLGVRNGEGT